MSSPNPIEPILPLVLRAAVPSSESLPQALSPLHQVHLSPSPANGPYGTPISLQTPPSPPQGYFTKSPNIGPFPSQSLRYMTITKIPKRMTCRCSDGSPPSHIHYGRIPPRRYKTIKKVECTSSRTPSPGTYSAYLLFVFSGRLFHANFVLDPTIPSKLLNICAQCNERHMRYSAT